MSGAVSPERPYGELITTTLRVMTWNVWGRFGPWQEREAALIRTLETLAPDVVTLQECWRDRSGQDQAVHLARALGYHSAYGGGTFLAEDWATGSALQSRWRSSTTSIASFPHPRRSAGAARPCSAASLAAAPGAASVRVWLWQRLPGRPASEVWHVMSRGWDPWTERPLPEVVQVAYPPKIQRLLRRAA